MEFLLESTWLVECLRGSVRFVQAVQERRTAGLAMSVVTLAELFSGGRSLDGSGEGGTSGSTSCQRGPSVGIDEAVARTWGDEDARLTLGGQKIGDLDLLVAATALAHNLTLCSQNRKHFERVPGLRLVTL